jgi:hypothetical protein
LTIESEEREAWTADVLANDVSRGALLKRDTLTVTLSKYTTIGISREAILVGVLGTRQDDEVTSQEQSPT